MSRYILFRCTEHSFPSIMKKYPDDEYALFEADENLKTGDVIIQCISYILTHLDKSNLFKSGCKLVEKRISHGYIKRNLGELSDQYGLGGKYCLFYEKIDNSRQTMSVFILDEMPKFIQNEQ